jgi:hypothetical protein
MTSFDSGTAAPARDRLRGLVFLCSALCAAGAAAQDAPPAAGTAPADEQEVSFQLQQLGGHAAEEIRGVEGLYTWPLGLRLDQSIVGAKLQLRYTASPALLPELSHLKIRLNGETVSALPLSRDATGTEVIREVTLDPGYFTDYNQLTVQLIGHYTTDCEDPLHSSLWASISGKSQLQLRVRRLPLAPDLALLPVPFFDPRDVRRLSLPFVFADKRSLTALKAGGILASWFGALADYRGAEFPVLIDRLPEAAHAVVLATNADHPAGLSLPAVNQPTLRVLAHPDGSAARLLVIQGRDDAQLLTAAAALASGQSALSGAVATIAHFESPPPRQPGDAPRWARTDVPVKLGSLVDDPLALQATGHAPIPIELDLRLPPDLFFWKLKGVPLKLIYRYTPPTQDDNSMLTVSMNEQLVRSFRLRPVSENPLLDLGDGQDAKSQRELLIPPFQLQPINQLQFRFAVDYHRPGPCRDSGMDLVRSAIDPESTLDLSGVPHYVEMPDLERFANAGYPFTRYADLSQTAVVLPRAETPDDIEAALALMGLMGRATGLAATAAAWVREDQLDTVRDRDLLIIGGGLGGSLLHTWNKTLPGVIDGMHHELSALSTLANRADALWRRRPQRGAGRDASAWRLAAQGEGPLAALVGFESPLRSGRSAVAVLASSREQQSLVWKALGEPGMVSRMHGDVVVLRGDQIESYDSGARYSLGHLPFWSGLWWLFSQHLALLSGAAVLAALLAAFWLRWALRRVAERRLGSKPGEP